MSRHRREEEELFPLPVDRGAASSAGLEGSGPSDQEPPARNAIRRGLAIGAVVAVLVGVGALAGSGGDDPAAPEPPPPTGELTSPTTAANLDDEPAPPGWRRGTPGPLLHRDHAAQVWTGTELVIWGGDPDGDSGAAYDPATDRWRVLPQPPLELGVTAVHDGRRLIAWDQNLNAAALDPAPGRGWERIPHPRSLAELPVWTGKEALFWVGRFAGSADGVWLYTPTVPGLNPG